uniref:Innexin n=1 Tax=Caenorhabditis japonica TaxID=281687 RepID=A0A8R1EEX2_CAEJA
MTMGVGRDPMKTFTNVYTAHARCVLGANYLNAKAFLFLYWWFAMCSLVCLCSAVRYTLVLVVPTFRRYLLKSLIMEEGHFLSKIGPPNPDLQLGKRDPLDFLVDFSRKRRISTRSNDIRHYPLSHWPEDRRGALATRHCGQQR